MRPCYPARGGVRLLAAGRDPEHYDSDWDDVLARYVAATAARERVLVDR